MWTFKNILALGLFLFGTTFLWMTASFAGRVPPPTGTAWTLVNGLALAAVAGFRPRRGVPPGRADVLVVAHAGAAVGGRIWPGTLLRSVTRRHRHGSARSRAALGDDVRRPLVT
jgi:hypothetical protein